LNKDREGKSRWINMPVKCDDQKIEILCKKYSKLLRDTSKVCLEHFTGECVYCRRKETLERVSAELAVCT